MRRAYFNNKFIGYLVTKTDDGRFLVKVTNELGRDYFRTWKASRWIKTELLKKFHLRSDDKCRYFDRYEITTTNILLETE